MNKNLDHIDRQILYHLQQNARITNLELAQLVELSPPGLQKRLRRLEEAGTIERHVTLVNREHLGFDLLCFVQVHLRQHDLTNVQAFKAAVQDIPEILACYHLTGETDYLLKVIVRNRKHLERFLIDVLTPLPGVDRLHTAVVLSDVKETTAYPINLQNTSEEA